MRKLLIILLLLIPLICEGQFIIGRNRPTRVQTDVASGIKPKFLSSDGKTKGWWISAYTSSVTKDGSNHVTAWADTLGNNNLSAYGGTPHWSSTGILFNGVGDYLRTASIAVYKPAIVYIYFKQVTWTSDDFIFDGYSGSGGLLYQHTASPKLAAYAAAISTDNSAMPLDTWGYAIVCFNGASSYLIINGTTNGTEDFGGNNMNGITIGASGNSTGFSNIEVKECILRYNNLDTQAQRDSVVAYFTKRYK